MTKNQKQGNVERPPLHKQAPEKILAEGGRSHRAAHKHPSLPRVCSTNGEVHHAEVDRLHRAVRPGVGDRLSHFPGASLERKKEKKKNANPFFPTPTTPHTHFTQIFCVKSAGWATRSPDASTHEPLTAREQVFVRSYVYACICCTPQNIEIAGGGGHTDFLPVTPV